MAENVLLLSATWSLVERNLYPVCPAASTGEFVDWKHSDELAERKRHRQCVGRGMEPQILRSRSPGGMEPMTGDYTLSDGEAAFGQEFENFSPGSGSVALNSTIQWDAPPGGFQAVHVSYGDSLIIPVTW